MAQYRTVFAMVRWMLVAAWIPVLFASLCDVDGRGPHVSIRCSGFVADKHLELAATLGDHVDALGLTLDLRHSMLNGSSASEIFRAVAAMRNLTSLTLDVSHCNLGPAIFKDIVARLGRLSNISNVSLYAAGNSLGGSATIDAASYVAPFAALSHLSALDLDLSGCFLEAHEVQALSAVLGMLAGLHSLKLALSMNTVSDQGAWALGEALGRLKILTSLSLNLAGSHVDNMGARQLGIGFGHLEQLETLDIDLGYNDCGAAGASDMGASIGMLAELKSLTLRMKTNSIGVDGAEGLVAHIPDLKLLEALSLDLSYISASSNRGQERGFGALLAVLGKLENLSDLSVVLTGNGIPESDAAKLPAVAAKFNTSKVPFVYGKAIEKSAPEIGTAAQPGHSSKAAVDTATSTTLPFVATTHPQVTSLYTTSVTEKSEQMTTAMHRERLSTSSSKPATSTTSNPSASTDVQGVGTTTTAISANVEKFVVVDDSPRHEDGSDKREFLKVNRTVPLNQTRTPLQTASEASGSFDMTLVGVVLLAMTAVGLYIYTGARQSSARRFNGGVNVAHSDDNENHTSLRQRHTIERSVPQRHVAQACSRVRSSDDCRHEAQPVRASANEPDHEDEWGDFESAQASGHDDAAALAPKDRQSALESMLEEQINSL